MPKVVLDFQLGTIYMVNMYVFGLNPYYVKVYQFQKAEAANRNTQNKFLCFAVCPPVVLVLGRPVKQWSSCGIGGHAVCRLLCILVYV